MVAHFTRIRVPSPMIYSIYFRSVNQLNSSPDDTYIFIDRSHHVSLFIRRDKGHLLRTDCVRELRNRRFGSVRFGVPSKMQLCNYHHRFGREFPLKYGDISYGTPSIQTLCEYSIYLAVYELLGRSNWPTSLFIDFSSSHKFAYCKK